MCPRRARGGAKLALGATAVARLACHRRDTRPGPGPPSARRPGSQVGGDRIGPLQSPRGDPEKAPFPLSRRRGRALQRRADRRRGLFRRLLSRLSPPIPLGDRGGRDGRGEPGCSRRQRAAAAETHPLPRHRGLDRPRHGPPAPSRQRRRPHQLRRRQQSQWPVPRRGGRRARLHRVRARPASTRSSARSRPDEGDYVLIPASTTHRWIPAAPYARSSSSRPATTSGPRHATCPRAGSSSSRPLTPSGTSAARRRS